MTCFLFISKHYIVLSVTYYVARTAYHYCMDSLSRKVNRKIIQEKGWSFRDWSLITRRGGLQNGRGGGHVKFYPDEKGGGRKKF